MAEKEKVTSLNPFNQWRTIIILSLTLGLAPFVPEPHIWGKIKWVAGGGVGMKLIDWGDLVFHGFPWVMFLRLVFLEVKRKFSGA